MCNACMSRLPIAHPSNVCSVCGHRMEGLGKITVGAASTVHTVGHEEIVRSSKPRNTFG